MYRYGLRDGLILRADPTNVPETLTAWIGGEWTAYPTIDQDWMERMPLSADQAQAALHAPVVGNSGYPPPVE